MEGYLEIWQGFFTRWCQYYFRLIDDTLIFGPNKDEIEGKIHLKVAKIVSTIDDPVSLIIHTGIQTLRLRAASIEERVRWVKKLKSTQKKVQQANYRKQRLEVDNQLGKNSKIKVLEQLTIELWQCHAILQNLIDELTLRFKGSINSKTLTDRLRITAQQIKLKNTQALKIIQEEIVNLKNRKMSSSKFMENPYPFEEDKSLYNSTKFLSFTENEEPKLNLKLSEIDRNANQTNNNTLFLSFEEPKFPSKILRRQTSYNQQAYLHPEKLKLLNENPVYSETVQHIDNSSKRTTLPATFVPEEKFSMISMLSGVGSDLTKFTFPVTINQPLSLLQKGCEQLYYSHLLDEANEKEDPEQRMLYVAAFLVSQYSLSQFRTKKPFNPLLGQTFQFIDTQRQFEYLSEQVSHHPPISAGHCRSNNYQIIDNSKSKTQFTGSSIRIVPASKGKIILQQLKDQYIFTKCTLALNNILIGKVYIENYGDIVIECPKNRTKALIQLKQQSFWSKSQSNVVEGVIKKDDNTIYTLNGKWNQSLQAIDSKTGYMSVIWEKTHKQNPNYYNFNDYTMQMNHLNKEKFQTIAPTDCRFRPDQRAVEFQKMELAATEKHRLEEKQRARRKENEKNKKDHSILWFTKGQDEEGNEIYLSNGKYWEQKHLGKWETCLDIY